MDVYAWMQHLSVSLVASFPRWSWLVFFVCCIVCSLVVFPSLSVLYCRVRVCDVVYVSGTAGTGTARVTGADESLLDVRGWEEDVEEEEEEEEEPTQ